MPCQAENNMLYHMNNTLLHIVLDLCAWVFNFLLQTNYYLNIQINISNLFSLLQELSKILNFHLIKKDLLVNIYFTESAAPKDSTKHTESLSIE